MDHTRKLLIQVNLILILIIFSAFNPQPIALQIQDEDPAKDMKTITGASGMRLEDDAIDMGICKSD